MRSLLRMSAYNTHAIPASGSSRDVPRRSQSVPAQQQANRSLPNTSIVGAAPAFAGNGQLKSRISILNGPPQNLDGLLTERNLDDFLIEVYREEKRMKGIVDILYKHDAKIRAEVEREGTQYPHERWWYQHDVSSSHTTYYDSLKKVIYAINGVKQWEGQWRACREEGWRVDMAVAVRDLERRREELKDRISAAREAKEAVFV